ncbi:FAD binding protein [Nitzschia inconspicua]|uniref:FAD binding protein n=1 Tax=Nitzschia inconspicua TaxID=303405 RepID=A0A9K3M5E4_9STRA|nr:FAD binding protein [Nitzschia inconspicua]
MKSSFAKKNYVTLLIILAVAHLAVISYILTNATHQETILLAHEIETKDRLDRQKVSPHRFTSQPPHQERHISITGIRVGGKRTNRKEIDHLSPSISAISDAVLQLDDKTVVMVGGFTENYRNVTQYLQFLNVDTQTWNKQPIRLPSTVAETHQGIALDKHRHILYIVSGQKGSGCMPATRVAVRYWIHQDRFEHLPLLPAPRYNPGVEIVPDPKDPNKSYLHVFGGAGTNRKHGAMDHWRLALYDSVPISSHGSESKWEVLEMLPDSGVHGTSFVTSDGHIHYTAYCQLDQGVVNSPSMATCHEKAVEDGQLLHHVADVGLTFRYPAFLDPSHAHWERVTDMPFPTCHGGSWFDNAVDTLYYVGGGLTNTQIKKGSAPKSLSLIQIYNANSMTWKVIPFDDAPRGAHLFSLTTWMDKERNVLYGLHPGSTIVAVNVSTSEMLTDTHIPFDWTRTARSYFDRTRAISIVAFQTCLHVALNGTSIEFYSMLDAYDSLNLYHQYRGTWNELKRDIQYPDIVAFPLNHLQVSSLVKCARQTGYRLCSRNGRHSYDGSSTCSRGIVVDVSRMDSWNVVDSAEFDATNSIMVRLGAGMTIGKVAIALESIGLALPGGSCATVGVTGLTLSGGQGPLSRLHGLTCDHLVAIDLVNEEGDYVHALDGNIYTDYLWFARGAGTVGHHFPGIITNLYFDNLVPIKDTEKSDDTVKQRTMSTIWTRARIRFAPNETVALQLLESWHQFLTKERMGRRNDDLDRRLTVEPWILMQQRKRKRQKERKGAEFPSISFLNETCWDAHVYLNVYFFGSSDLHTDHFLPNVLRNLQWNWTSVPGHVVVLERLDHLAFSRKLSGVQSNLQLGSGQHGHDINHQKWKGYSAVVAPPKAKKNMDIQHGFRNVVDIIFNAEPKCRRYAEFKPMGGAITSASESKGAFKHRDALWMVLINYFVDDYGIVDNRKRSEVQLEILSESKRRNDQFLQLMRKLNWFIGKYSGYLEHTSELHRDLTEYYGDHAREINRIKRKRDPNNSFRHWLPNSFQAWPGDTDSTRSGIFRPLLNY